MGESLQPFEPLLLLLQAPSKDTIAQLLQALWRSRRCGLDLSQKSHFQEQLRLSSTAQLDEISGCLLKLIRKSVYESLNKTEIQGLFPLEFHPQLQKLLAVFIQKFQPEWREDAIKHQISLPRFKEMTWETDSADQASDKQTLVSKMGIVNLKICDQVATGGEYDVKFQVSRETLGVVLDSLYVIQDKLASISADTK